jgi:hypothetical protein
MIFLLLSVIFLFARPSLADNEFVSVTVLPDYEGLRGCVHSCWHDGIYVWDHVAEAEGCDRAAGDYLNSCYCRSDLTDKGKLYLSTCVSSSCSNTNDIASAVSFFNSYCSNYNQPVTIPVAAAGTTTNAPSVAGVVYTTIATVTNTVRVSSSSTTRTDTSEFLCIIFLILVGLTRMSLEESTNMGVYYRRWERVPLFYFFDRRQ